jgi:hypothetical protein
MLQTRVLLVHICVPSGVLGPYMLRAGSLMLVCTLRPLFWEATLLKALTKLSLLLNGDSHLPLVSDRWRHRDHPDIS